MASTGAAANAVIIIGAVLLLCSLHIDAKPRYNDVDNCGKCKHKCPRAPPHSERTCKNGKCGTKCKRGWLDCDQKKANGCEVDVKSLKTDVKNCGSCGNVCPVPLSNQFGTGLATCTKGVCGHTLTCATGFADCDGDPSNGCELDVKSNVNNCGSCGSVCPTGQLGTDAPTCTDGVCGLASTCAKDFEDCDSDPSNGCESDVRSDVKNCGSCGNVCPVPLSNQYGTGAATCTRGVCGYTLTCAKNFADCDGDPSNGCEIDLVGVSSGPDHCGSCDNACPASKNSTAWAYCNDGVCTFECNFFLGLGNCDNDYSNGCETYLLNNVNNCGACGQVCTTPPKGQIACSGGGCAGNCVKGFYENCDGNPNNGCETLVWSDVNHCGSCGNVCPSPPNATPSCSSNACKFTCKAGFSDCDLVASNGCEVQGVCPL